MQNADSVPSKEQILSAQAALGATFTNEYVEFLAKYNGAVPEPNILRISDKNSAGVNAFIPIERISYETGLIGEPVAENFFPFAYAEEGNYVCTPLSPSRDSGIYFFDHEIPGLESLTKIAESLNEFLSHLQPMERSEAKLKPGQVKKAWIDPRFLK